MFTYPQSYDAMNMRKVNSINNLADHLSEEKYKDMSWKCFRLDYLNGEEFFEVFDIIWRDASRYNSIVYSNMLNEKPGLSVSMNICYL